MKTTIHYYRFEVGDLTQKRQYELLIQNLTAMGLTLFDSISSDHSKFYKELIKPLDGSEITLDTSFVFNNQWNTKATPTSENGLRVFDWSEAIYPNRRIKEGMWLEQTEEMREIRNNQYKCNYCGKRYNKPEFSFCQSCLGSEYLNETELPLLFLTPVGIEKTRFDGVNLPDGFIEKYREAQKIARHTRLIKQQQNKMVELQKEIDSAKKQFAAFKLLIDNNINFDNVIYYKHIDTFCFGWRNSLSEDEIKELGDNLRRIGFYPKYNVKFNK